MPSAQPSQGMVSSEALTRDDLVHLYAQLSAHLRETSGQPTVAIAGRAIQLEDAPVAAPTLQPVALSTSVAVPSNFRAIDRTPAVGDWFLILRREGSTSDCTVGRLYQVTRVDVEGRSIPAISFVDDVGDRVSMFSGRGVSWELVEPALVEPAPLTFNWDAVNDLRPRPEHYPPPAETFPVEGSTWPWRVVTDRPPVVGDWVRITHVPDEYSDFTAEVGGVVQLIDVDTDEWSRNGAWDGSHHADDYMVWHDGDMSCVQAELVERVTNPIVYRAVATTTDTMVEPLAESRVVPGSLRINELTLDGYDSVPMPVLVQSLAETITGVTRETFRALFLEHVEELSHAIDAAVTELDDDQWLGAIRRMRERS
jgi:hypothetical protein